MYISGTQMHIIIAFINNDNTLTTVLLLLSVAHLNRQICIYIIKVSFSMSKCLRYCNNECFMFISRQLLSTFRVFLDRRFY